VKVVHEKSRVSLIGTPAKVDCSMAGSPSLVPGILANRFGLAAVSGSRLLVDRQEHIGQLVPDLLAQFQKQRLTGKSTAMQLLTIMIVIRAVRDGMIEDSGIRGEPSSVNRRCSVGAYRDRADYG
jgi:hypothetical protein